MLKRQLLKLGGVVSVAVFLTAGCSEKEASVDVDVDVDVVAAVDVVASVDDGRWYTSAQLRQGEELFQANCSACHGESAASTVDWRKTDALGNYPPPPLNGTAHAWHHPMSVLVQTIENGGAPVGGVMPAFGGKFNDNEIRATIAYFQSFWSDEIYARWQEIGSR